MTALSLAKFVWLYYGMPLSNEASTIVPTDWSDVSGHVGREHLSKNISLAVDVLEQSAAAGTFWVTSLVARDCCR